jgi:hypothetical protein
MGFSPRFDPLAVFRPAEVTLILRLLQPAALRFGFALAAAGRLRAVALVVAIAVIGSEELLAMAAFALSRGISLPDSKSGASPAESASVEAAKNRRDREANETSPNKGKKSFCVKFRRKSAVRHPVFKPVGLPDFQIGADTRWAWRPKI